MSGTPSHPSGRAVPRKNWFNRARISSAGPAGSIGYPHNGSRPALLVAAQASRSSCSKNVIWSFSRKGRCRIGSGLLHPRSYPSTVEQRHGQICISSRTRKRAGASGQSNPFQPPAPADQPSSRGTNTHIPNGRDVFLDTALRGGVRRRLARMPASERFRCINARACVAAPCFHRMGLGPRNRGGGHTENWLLASERLQFPQRHSAPVQLGF